MRPTKTPKNKKQARSTTRGTLGQKHSERLDKFAADMQLLPQKKKTLQKMERNLKAYLRMNVLTNSENRKLVETKENIESLRREIRKIEKCEETLEYMTDVLPVLVDYYDNVEIDEGGFNEEMMNDVDPRDKRNVLNYLMEPNTSKSSGEKKAPAKITRAKLHEDYLCIVDPRRRPPKKESSICGRRGCGGEKILYQSIGRYVCSVCGIEEEEVVVTEKPKYKDPVQDTSNYAYKRINHLTEILSQLQDKGMTDIPKNVYRDIYREIRRRNIDKNDLDIFSLRGILKILNYRNYYEHVPHILQVINEKKPPNFTRKQEADIKKMFKDIQGPFAIYCPKERKNFLNYSYFLHKVCRILGLTKYIGYFPLLKNNKKLLQHDRIWKKICNHMGWPFHKSL